MEKQDIFILSLFQHGNKVRGTTLSHLLRGKRTTSILIYGYFNQLLPYFGLFPQLVEAEVQKTINKLRQQGFLNQNPSGDLLWLSEKGQSQLIVTPALKLPDLQGVTYSNTDDEYVEGLLFASQIISEYVHGNNKYVPIESNPAKQLILKRWFQTLTKEPALLGQQIYHEWHRLILAFPARLQSSLVNLLSGHTQIGQTASQLIDDHHLSAFEGYLLRKNYSHRLIRMISEQPTDYPLLSSVYPFYSRSFINDSAAKSYQLLKAGRSLQEICRLRKLKESTVVDHLIEAAILNEDFDFTLVLDEATCSALKSYEKIVNDLRQWHYREVLADQPTVDFLKLRCYQIMCIREGS